MPVFTRRSGETIIDLPTGEQVTVTVLSLKGKQVRLGTNAPEDLTILREEPVNCSQTESNQKLSTISVDKYVDPFGGKCRNT